MSLPSAKSFRALLERDGTRLNWVIIRIPLDVAKVWGTRGTLKVKGTVDGFAFRSALFPTGQGGHIMIVNKRMRKGAGIRVGEVAKFRLEPDTEKRIVNAPAELKRALSQDKSLLRWYEKLNDSTRKWIGEWIQDVKGPEARVRRSEQIAVRLLETMEAEQEMPPMLRLAFERNARAREGWEKMSLARRRGHLLGIFYYRTPEGRARRLAKAIEDALQAADRKEK
ncbi:MAG: YdeI/OmpD-associated family protein [Bdellovibrionota bacterium]